MSGSEAPVRRLDESPSGSSACVFLRSDRAIRSIGPSSSRSGQHPSASGWIAVRHPHQSRSAAPGAAALSHRYVRRGLRLRADRDDVGRHRIRRVKLRPVNSSAAVSKRRRPALHAERQSAMSHIPYDQMDARFALRYCGLCHDLHSWWLDLANVKRPWAALRSTDRLWLWMAPNLVSRSDRVRG